MEMLRVTSRHEIIERVQDFIQTFQHQNVEIKLEADAYLEKQLW